MKIAVSSQGSTKESVPDSRFGRARSFVVYDDTTDVWQALDNVQNMQAAQGAGIQAAAHVVNAGCTHLITGHCGPKAFAVLEKAGVAVFSAEAATVEGSIKKHLSGESVRMTNADVEGHW